MRNFAAYLIEDYGGLAAALRESIGAPLPPSEQARVEHMIAPARAILTEICCCIRVGSRTDAGVGTGHSIGSIRRVAPLNFSESPEI